MLIYSREHYIANKAEYAKRHTEWRKAHPDKMREYVSAYAQRNRETIKLRALASASNYYRDHKDDPGYKEKAQERSKAWYKKNRDRLRAKYAANPTSKKQQSKQWRLDNPEASVRAANNQRAQRHSALGSFTPEQWRAMKRIYGNECLACGSYGRLTVDHVIPIARGGGNDIANLQPLCKPCNQKKMTKTVDYRTTYRLSIEEVLALIASKTAKLHPRVH